MQGTIGESVTEVLKNAEDISKEQGDNMSAIGLQWGDKLSNPLAVSTVSMAMGATTTIMNHTTTQRLNGELNLSDADISDEEIEKTIKAIQEAIHKTR
jgi:aryl-alcohol dehydrogenase-like predicted oxidoreductase